MPPKVSPLDTILVVDDTPANIDVLRGLLSDEYQVKVANSGEKALRIAGGEDPPDLILLDIMMPGMSGYEVCRRLKANARTAAIPVIFVTAKTRIIDETRGFEYGAVDYITKPIEPPIVSARVRTHLALRHATRKLADQNQSLKEYARLRDEVERITQHDLRTPLSSVISVPAMLMEELELTDDQIDLLNMLQDSGHRMLQIINSSLDMLKMETGRYQLAPQPVDLIGILHQIHGETRENILSKTIKVLVLFSGRPLGPHDSIWIWGEEMLLYTMLANLLKNAVEASPPNETITVSLEKGNKALLRIHNKGEVPKEIKENFFQKFVTANKTGGTGLGTYIAKLITDTLGGHINMTSSTGEGTLIEVQLPLSDKAGELKPRDSLFSLGNDFPLRQAGPGSEQEVDLTSMFSSAKTSGGTTGNRFNHDIKILLVDDYSNMRRITKSALRRMGYVRISEAENGEKALSMALTHKYDLIISDVNMPQMDGLEFLKAVRSHPEIGDTPFILITGEANKETVLGAAVAGVSAFILKPFSPENLKGKMEKVIPLIKK